MIQSRKTIANRLIAQGFDQTYISRASGVRPKCSQCEALVINGIATHETGCPNARHECHGCYESIPLNQRYCPDCM
jgi:hypothetical protein